MRVKVKYSHVLDTLELVERVVLDKQATDPDGRIDLKDLLDLLKDGSEDALRDADLEGKYDLMRDIVVAALSTDGDMKTLKSELIKIAKEHVGQYVTENTSGILGALKRAGMGIYNFFRRVF